jgi:hypothetical protein
VRRIPVLVLAVGVLVALAGCSAGSPTSTPTVHAASAKAAPVPDGVVGTGALTSWNGKTTGSLQVLAKGGSFTFVLSHFSTDVPGQNIFALADSPVKMSQCAENNVWQLGLDDQGNAPKPTMTFGLPNVVGAFADPSFFATFLFIQSSHGPVDANGQLPKIRGCQQAIAALTTINWTMKSIYPHLAVRDRGAATGARGTTTNLDGTLSTYTTARLDTWENIAHRFGLTPAELLYLNPIRHPENEPAIAYEDQVLNLSPANRGNSETRRPGAH